MWKITTIVTLWLCVLCGGCTNTLKEQQERLKIQGNTIILLEDRELIAGLPQQAKGVKTWKVTHGKGKFYNVKGKYAFTKEGVLESAEIITKQGKYPVTKRVLKLQRDGSWLAELFVFNLATKLNPWKLQTQMHYLIDEAGQIYQQVVTSVEDETKAPIYLNYSYEEGRLTTEVEEGGKPYRLSYEYNPDNTLAGLTLTMDSKLRAHEKIIQNIVIEHNEEKRPIKERVNTQWQTSVGDKVSMEEITVYCNYDRYTEKGDWVKKTCDNSSIWERELGYYEAK